jgi:RNA polymerase sigma-70 factor (ECF subfamily)
MQNSSLNSSARQSNTEQLPPFQFEQEMAPYLDSLYRNAVRLSGNQSDAEDLLQDTYLRAFRFFSQHQRSENAKAWLFQIMNRLFIDEYRKKSRRGEQLSYDNLEEFYLYNRLNEGTLSSDQSLSMSNPENILIEKIGIEAAIAAVNQLPETFRDTVALAMEDFTYREISEILQAPIGTIRSRLSRGRKLLQRVLWEVWLKRKSFSA